MTTRKRWMLAWSVAFGDVGLQSWSDDESDEGEAGTKKRRVKNQNAYWCCLLEKRFRKVQIVWLSNYFSPGSGSSMICYHKRESKSLFMNGNSESCIFHDLIQFNT